MLKILKWVGIVFGSIVLLLMAAGGVLFVKGKGTVTEIRAVDPPLKMVEADSATVARGEHLVDILSCHLCHGEDLSGQVFLDIPPFRAVASNLTSGEGGVGKNYTDADWDRSLRYGVKPTGQPMMVMPAVLFHGLTDADAAAVISYLKRLPAVDNALPQTEFRAPLYLMAGAAGQDVFVNLPAEDATRLPEVAVEPTAKYGAYLASLSCVECHGQDLRGGTHPEPGAPDGPNLAAAGQWSLEDFKTALRTGKTPYGTELRTQYMPWEQSYRHLNDIEIEALHVFLGEI